MARIALQTLRVEVFAWIPEVMRFKVRLATRTFCQHSRLSRLDRKTIREHAPESSILIVLPMFLPNFNKHRFDFFGRHSSRSAHHFKSLFEVGTARGIAVSHSCKQPSFFRCQDSSIRLTGLSSRLERLSATYSSIISKTDRCVAILVNARLCSPTL